MANELTIRPGLSVQNGSLRYNVANSFNADQTNIGGPTPGTVTCSTNGTDIDLSELTTPGVAYITNLDVDNLVTVGRWDPVTSLFYPFMDLLPGESYVVRLSTEVLDEFSGVGTATTGTASTLRCKAQNQPCKVRFDVFEA